ncbi:hypothetical protein B0J15DRAFT_139112 [Fusarium solani]|uniref:Apple domain-containing protein n=1 Tax=Fusarium solani TaxID=169388 RepID=A0A9P9GK24_FUSSL|nr:uncharacterized protein B0J15DRAFT_139112 [Fusarium solani]KAH7240586.1 hypothetical protein B0J15DRAFT_139112 [Fusarium solani]
MGQRKTLKAKDEQFVKGWRILVVSFQLFDVEMAFKMIVGFAVALAAVGADALVCRPGSSSVALSPTLTTSTAILETSSIATVSTSEESTTASTETTGSTTISIASSSTEESTSASSTTSIIISTTAESTSATTTAGVTTTTSIIISTSEEPRSSIATTTTSTTSSEPASCPTEGLVCGDDGHVPPRPGLKYIIPGVSGVEACKAACLEVADCAFFLINRGGSKACTLFRMSKEEAGFQKVPSASHHSYERGCFVC